MYAPLFRIHPPSQAIKFLLKIIVFDSVGFNVPLFRIYPPSQAIKFLLKIIAFDSVGFNVPLFRIYPPSQKIKYLLKIIVFDSYTHQLLGSPTFKACGEIDIYSFLMY